MSVTPVPGAKMIYLIKRKRTSSREELVVHWFANHMPGVISNQKKAAGQGRLHASRYIATLFDASQRGEHIFDGMAQLWFAEPLPGPKKPIGETPRDTFQQMAEPYVPWATVEYAVIDGELKVEPLTLNEPFPCTRSGLYKKCFLVKAKPRTNFADFFSHWLEIHIPNVESVMHKVGGFRYCVSLSLDPAAEPYAGMAELYFERAVDWGRYRTLIEPDGIEQWIDPEGSVTLTAQTEMIGIP